MEGAAVEMRQVGQNHGFNDKSIGDSDDASSAIHQVTIEFRNVSHEVKTTTGCLWNRRTKAKTILFDVSGVVEPGDLVALMGASGAGKSTLLNGDVLINGEPADSSSILRTLSCFIQQEDIFYGFLTVNEHLSQQAAFRIPLDKSSQAERVRAVIEQFSLTKSRNSRIGNVEQGCSRGISGGEKKRLSLATELLINPSLIFADEPTSGLDAFMAEAVVDVLKLLADSGHTVVSTIHQPSSDVFAMFNKVLLLSDGHVVYYGPRMAALPYFMRLGHPCPPYTNPADFLIELLAVDWENPGTKLKELAHFADHWHSHGKEFLHEWDTGLAEKFEKSITASTPAGVGLVSPATALKSVNKLASRPFRLPNAADGAPLRVSRRGIVKNLLQRAVVTTARNPGVVRARLIQTVVTALLGGLVYLRLNDENWYSKCGAIFFMLVNLGFMSVYTAMTVFISEKKIVVRERDAGLYHLATYYFSKIASDFMFQVHLPIIYTAICWFMMGLHDSFPHFLLGCLFTWLVTLAVSSFGYIIAAVAPHIGIGVALGPMLILPTLIVSGFVIQKPSLPKFWIWLYVISPFVYGFNGLMKCVFLNVEFKIDRQEAYLLGDTSAMYAGAGDTYAVDPMIKTSGNEVLEQFAITASASNYATDILVLLAWAFFGRLLGCILFCWAHRRKRR